MGAPCGHAHNPLPRDGWRLMTNAERRQETLTEGRRRDPQQMIVLRAKFEAAFVRKFRELKKNVFEVMVGEDRFGLSGREVYQFPRSADKVDGFMDWLREQERRGILEMSAGVTHKRAAEQAWTSTYIRAGYAKGIRAGSKELRRQGVKVADTWTDNAFTRPMHADAVGLIYSRTYSELEGITAAMDQAMSRALAEGIARGEGVRKVTARLFNVIDSVGIVRARRIARTEMTRASHVALVNSYREAGVEGVKILGEFKTVGDSAVCEECEFLEGKVFALDTVEAMIPVHPNCRCMALPVVESVNGVELE